MHKPNMHNSKKLNLLNDCQQYFNQNQISCALRIFKKILSTNCKDFYLLHSFGVLALNHLQPEYAIRFFLKAAKINATETLLIANIGLSYLQLKSYDQATHYFKKALNKEKNHIYTLHHLVDLYLEKKQAQQAITIIQTLMQLGETSHNLYAKLAEAHLLEQSPQNASEAITQGLSLKPLDTKLLALQSIVFSQTNQKEQENTLTNFDKFVMISTQKEHQHTYIPFTPEEFHQEFIEYITNYKNLAYNSSFFSTTNGYQTLGNLLIENNILTQTLSQIIHYNIQVYVTSLPKEPIYPITLKTPKHYRLTAWGVKLAQGGHQCSHIHEEGWISGVYYLKVPNFNTKDIHNHGGYLEVGGGKEGLYQTKPKSLLIEPHVGNMILFPSYLWHRTIPFESDQERYCLAFDAIPIQT